MIHPNRGSYEESGMKILSRHRGYASNAPEHNLMDLKLELEAASGI